MRREIAPGLVFIDVEVADRATLLAGLQSGLEVVLLKHDGDGLAQITAALQTRKNLTSLHIVSHGEAGKLLLGNGSIDRSTLARRSREIKSWSQALAPNAEILLYGCNVAVGETGRHFVRWLSQLTGAKAAASQTLTGSAAFGGDWNLGFKVGQMFAPLAFREETRVAYRGVLNTTRVSVSSDGDEGNDVSTFNSSISANGRFVAFWSRASNLVDGDTNGRSDIFVHDRQTGETTRVSVTSDGTQSSGFFNSSQQPSISADGRYIAFTSSANNLVDGDTNGSSDTFVHDRQTGETTRVSVTSDGTQSNGFSYWPSISADGRYVTFRSDSSNLVDGDTNGFDDIFVHDRQTGETTRVSVTSDGTQGNGNSSGNSLLAFPSISADGRYVAFYSQANNLVDGDTNGTGDTFIHDRQTGETALVSVASNGTQSNGFSYWPSISTDGRYVAFQSDASNLVDGDTNGFGDIFVRDRQTGETTRVSIASDGTQVNSPSFSPSISGDGRYISFVSYASNLVGGATNGTSNIFVHDRQTGETTRVSVDSDGNLGNGGSSWPAISADGSAIAFRSFANNLVDDDTNGRGDIFVRQLRNPETPGDTFATALDSGLSAANPGTFTLSSEIGNNPAVDPTADVDLISFQLDAGSLAIIDIDAETLGSDLDSYIRLFDSDGNQIAFNDDNTAPGETLTLDSYLDFIAPESGTYYVGVSSYGNPNYDPTVAGSGNGSSTGEYTLNLTVTEPETPGDTFATALDSGWSAANPGTFTLSSEIGNNPAVDPTADVDLISFQLDAGSRATIDIDAETLGSNLDSFIRVFDGDGNEIAYSDDNTAPGETFSYDSYLNFIAPESGTYYVGVSSYGNPNYDPTVVGSGNGSSTGEYTLNLTVDTPSSPFLLYSNNATNIRAIDLASGTIPNINVGTDIAASAWAEDNLNDSAYSRILSNGDFFTVWNTNTSSGYSRFSADGNGNYTETQMGAFPARSRIVGVDDLNGDGLDDVMMVRRVSPVPASSNFDYQVAFGQSDGSFDFSAPATTLLQSTWAPQFTIADADNDGNSDLIFHDIRSGGFTPTNLYMLQGRGDGTFAPTSERRLLLSSPEGSTAAVFGDFDGDGDLDAFLPPDDDMRDMGQSYIAFNDGAGNFSTPQQSIDFRPNNEGPTSDRFWAFADAVDVDLDGNVDIVGYLNPIGSGGTYSAEVYRGDGTGQFSTTGEVLVSLPGSSNRPRFAWGNRPLLADNPGDTLSAALDTGLSSATPGRFVFSSEIGNNPRIDSNSDVDFFSFQLDAGSRMTIDIDADAAGSTLDSMLRLFDTQGNEIGFSDDNAAPGEGSSLDSYLDFEATESGTYYVGLSGYANWNYNPEVEGSGSGSSTGEYDIEFRLTTINGNDGPDTLRGGDGPDGIDGGGGRDRIAGNLGDDTIFGGDGDDTLWGDFDNSLSGGDDLIFGGAGRDRIRGRGGNDTIFGEAGDDFISGDAGDDLIRGGVGSDRIAGDLPGSDNRGSDTFVLAIGEGSDIFLDFTAGEDFIGLADGLTLGQLELAQDSNNALINYNGETLATLNNVQTSSLTADMFVPVV